MTVTMLDGLAITPIVLPSDVDGPEGADFRATVAVRNEVLTATRGRDATIVTPAQVLAAWRDQTDEEVHGWLLRSAGEVVGRALMYMPLEAGSERAQLRPEILPAHRGRGIGRRTLSFLEDRARERGRSILQSWTDHRPAQGGSHVARTGIGEVPDDHEARFALKAGYALEQVYRISALDLTPSLDTIPALLDDARTASAGYRFVSWSGPAPEAYVDDYAWLKSRMSTDAPAGGSVWDEESWDAARIRRMEAQWRDMGFTVLVGAAQHVESGRLAAFTELLSLRQSDGVVEQNDTLVLKEHRGHRLGALVKCEMIALGRAAFPEGERILTGNAEENRPMLSINEAMGFRPVRYAGDWQKTVA